MYSGPFLGECFTLSEGFRLFRFIGGRICTIIGDAGAQALRGGSEILYSKKEGYWERAHIDIIVL